MPKCGWVRKEDENYLRLPPLRERDYMVFTFRLGSAGLVWGQGERPFCLCTTEELVKSPEWGTPGVASGMQECSKSEVRRYVARLCHKICN